MNRDGVISVLKYYPELSFQLYCLKPKYICYNFLNDFGFTPVQEASIGSASFYSKWVSSHVRSCTKDESVLMEIREGVIFFCHIP